MERFFYFGEWVTYSAGFGTPDSGAGTGKELAGRGAH